MYVPYAIKNMSHKQINGAFPHRKIIYIYIYFNTVF